MSFMCYPLIVSWTAACCLLVCVFLFFYFLLLFVINKDVRNVSTVNHINCGFALKHDAAPQLVQFDIPRSAMTDGTSPHGDHYGTVPRATKTGSVVVDGRQTTWLQTIDDVINPLTLGYVTTSAAGPGREVSAYLSEGSAISKTPINASKINTYVLKQYKHCKNSPPRGSDRAGVRVSASLRTSGPSHN